jgi:hypothetical protein
MEQLEERIKNAALEMGYEVETESNELLAFHSPWSNDI